MERFIATMKLGDDLRGRLRDRAMQQYIESHPENELLAFVFGEMNNARCQVLPFSSCEAITLLILATDKPSSLEIADIVCWPSR
jgi:hypothetical protein